MVETRVSQGVRHRGHIPEIGSSNLPPATKKPTINSHFSPIAFRKGDEKMGDIIREFETIYTKKTKHRARCFECNKLIENGNSVVMRQVEDVKYYPIKGIMKFVKWQFKHLNH